MRICRQCGRDETQGEFKTKANICSSCNSAYMTDYRRRNRAKLREQVQRWKEDNRERNRASTRANYATAKGKAGQITRTTRTPRTWLSRCMYMAKRKCEKPGPHDHKRGPALEFAIDLEFLLDMFVRQGGRCAITGLEMVHRHRNMRSISIDRIDSGLGYIPGNVQLVCTAVNRAKNDHPQAEAVEFFRATRNPPSPSA